MIPPGGAGGAPSTSLRPGRPESVDPVRFFDDDDMDFATRCVLSGVRHGMSEVGETLATIESIRDGEPESWLEAFVGLGRRLRDVADSAADAGHRYSAWNAALRSSNYLYAGSWWAPATSWADKGDELWEEHRSSWELAIAHWPTPVIPVRLPHDGDTLPGYWFTSPAATSGPAPAVVLVQGLGTPISDVPMTGLDGALARGHHVVVVDGPGQGAALHRQGWHLDDSWPEVLCTALEWLATRPEVDPTRLTLLGVGHGALFAAQAAAVGADPTRATGPAALVLDPAVVDLGADAAASVAAATTERARALLTTTTTAPTGASTLDEAVGLLARHRVGADELAAITCPTLVLTADAAFGFRDQEATLLAALRCPHEQIVLRSDHGAGADNGIDASQVHDAAVFDWLDATLGRSGDGPRDAHGGPHDG